MNATTVIGIGASIFTGISLLPQLVKTIREKAADGISFSMLLVLLTGLCLWVIYGIKMNDWILVVANAFSALLNLLIMIFGFIFHRKKP